MGLMLDELDMMEYGMVMDMMSGSGNDTGDYPKKATQAQFNEFVGG